MAASRELTMLTALAQALGRSPDLAESLDSALGTVSELLGLETGWVWLLEDDSEEPRLAAARSLPPVLRDHPQAMHGDCYCLSTFRAGDLRGAANVNVVWCSRLEKVVRPADDGDPGGTSLRCHASVPLAVGERRLGMLNVASSDWRVLSDDELSLLTTAGALVSLAVERSRLEIAGARAVAAEERNRLAREIHDTLAQSLAGLTMQLEVLDALAAPQGDERLTQAVTRALALTRSTLQEARRSVLDLRAAPLEGRALTDALHALAVATGAATPGLRVEVVAERFDRMAGKLPPAVEVGLYRIAQQALANVARHAGPAQAIVRLTLEPGRVHLRVEDNGVGFDPTTMPPDRFGVIGMGERARLLGGELVIETSPGGGTAIDVVVPLPDPLPGRPAATP
ncbi:MAG TPA: GAF domain-containing sensor histidine kinase [Gemmatimonadales bacterium]|jgi:two-component system NarL family sensor kinase|nr:GAF domain-containing sensor histidine kinase [Gemmatimonadales bacterium]